MTGVVKIWLDPPDPDRDQRKEIVVADTLEGWESFIDFVVPLTSVNWRISEDSGWFTYWWESD